MNYSRLIKDLKRGNTSEDNLKAYADVLLKSYQELASINFTLQLTESYDVLMESAEQTPEIFGQFQKMLSILKTGILDEETLDFASLLEEISQCREAVLAFARKREAYVTFLAIYEHLYNREEYRILDKKNPVDGEELTLNVMNFIMQERQPEVMNERIQSVLAELPIRLTRQKFFDFLEHSMQGIVGMRRDLAEDFFEQFLPKAHPCDFDHLDPADEQRYALAKRLWVKDIQTLDAANFTELSHALEQSGRGLAADLSYCMDLIPMVNDLYILLLSLYDDVGTTGSLKEMIRVMQSFLKGVEGGGVLDMDENIMVLLYKAAGRYSDLQGEHLLLEEALPEIILKSGALLERKHADACAGHQFPTGIGDNKQLAFDDSYQSLQIIERLSGTNPFVNLKHVGAYDCVDNVYIHEKLNELKSVYEESFVNYPRYARRAVMSAAFGEMPVSFDRLEDVQKFILQCLAGCQSIYELTAVEDLLNNMLHQEGVSFDALD